MNKNEVIKKVEELNAIINSTTYKNSLDMLVEFFKITSVLHDELKNIKTMRTKKKYLFFSDSEIEIEKSIFCRNIVRAGRNLSGFNRTSPGEEVSSDHIFLGGIHVLLPLTVSKAKNLEETDPKSYHYLLSQAYDMILSYKGIFSTNFLA